MDEAIARRAAEPFFTTKGFDGTGLGLSMVQGFVEQFGGSFQIASVISEGTTVELRLPAAKPVTAFDGLARGP
jgi:signal transduction histidine kinase